ncbi:MAG: hypothetical protein FWD81_03885 [Methanomassiliicoccaceae archaeon]|nr:hypothetical protein [Methanomassiliicoccaceae archaeon]
MSYYCAIFTDEPIEKMGLEKNSKYPNSWIYRLQERYIEIDEEDELWKDPSDIRELHFTNNLYFNRWGCGDTELCLADDYVRIVGGKIYIAKLLFLEDEMLGKVSPKILEKIEVLDLKDLSEKIRNNTGRLVVDLEPYVIYEIVNSGNRYE